MFKFLSSRAALAATVLIVLQGALIYSAVRPESPPSGRALAQFPTSLGSWTLLQEGVIDADTQAVLKADDLLNRYYSGGGAGANLFVAAFRSQRNGKAPHSPKNCLPGSGWTPEGSRTIHLDVPGSGSIPVNRYVVRRGEERSVVLYWYATAHSEIADEYVSKLYLMYEGLRYHRSDAAVYRVIARVGPDGEEAAERKAIGFVNTFYPPLKQRMWTN